MGLASLFRRKTNYFNPKIQPKCVYCQYGRRQRENGLIFCEKKGPMEQDDSCNKFLYAPLKRIPVKQLQNEGVPIDEELYVEIDYEAAEAAAAALEAKKAAEAQAKAEEERRLREQAEAAEKKRQEEQAAADRAKAQEETRRMIAEAEAAARAEAEAARAEAQRIAQEQAVTEAEQQAKAEEQQQALQFVQTVQEEIQGINEIIPPSEDAESAIDEAERLAREEAERKKAQRRAAAVGAADVPQIAVEPIPEEVNTDKPIMEEPAPEFSQPQESAMPEESAVHEDSAIQLEDTLQNIAGLDMSVFENLEDVSISEDELEFSDLEDFDQDLADLEVKPEDADEIEAMRDESAHLVAPTKKKSGGTQMPPASAFLNQKKKK
ncbi:MAG: hypothetical protein V3G42_04010 [Oscillospiraceae bacterium]